METDLLIAAGSFVGSMIANTAGESLVTEAGKRLFAHVKDRISPDPKSPSGVTINDKAEFKVAAIEEANSVVNDSAVLRRALMVRQAFKGARVLWIDDNPGSTYYERQALISLGAEVLFCDNTASALHLARQINFDLVISDMERDGDSTAGLSGIRELQAINPACRVVIYLLQLDEARGIPAGAFGITNRPDELLHITMDVLERDRI